MISSVTIAIITLQIIESSQLALNVAMLAYMAIQLLIFAWNCNEIIVESVDLANSLYESNWYHQSKSTKLILRVMMMRCQKPLRLIIGFFGPMDLEAGVSRLKLGYSYTTIVKN
ncbi:odorant receptor 30a-like [Cylas formicarius]|uniref:odorant receptor 30a-like n=1 Tax=Cylas formicarius TaxID=197179 RepID=UPI002958C489|nr:odorant receptor 30a-like [Cylas formicarius]